MSNYIEGISGVDLQDSYLFSYSITRKFVKDYKKNISLLHDGYDSFNTFVLFYKIQYVPKSKKYSFSKFWIDVAEQIWQNINIYKILICIIIHN